MCISQKLSCSCISVFLSGEKLSWNNHVKHFGNTLSYNLSNENDVHVKQGHFYVFVNTLCAKFKCVHGDINLAAKLYCHIVILYIYIYVILLLCLWLLAEGPQLQLVWCYLCCLEQSSTSCFPVALQYTSFLATLWRDGIPIRDQLLKKRCV